MPQATLLQGDCLEVMPTLAAGSVDLVLCDLPYGTTACKWDAIIPFEPLWAEYRRLAKSSAAIVLTASQPFTTALIGSNLEDFRYEWIWEKDKPSNFASAQRQPLKYHESVAVFYRKQPIYHPLKVPGRLNNSVGSGVRKGADEHRKGDAVFYKNNDGMKYPKSVQKFNRETGLHPTQKPVALLEYLIRTYTNEGDTVLDNTMGSGSTGVACMNTGRNFIGIERDPTYFAIAEKRIAEAQKPAAQPMLFAAE